MRPPLPLLAVLILLTALVYWPGLHGDFFFDDGGNIVHNDSIHIKQLDSQSLWAAMIGSQSGLFRRPVSMLSFALNHYASGMDPFYFKLTNLAIHAINVILVFLVTSLLLRAYRRRASIALTNEQVRYCALFAAAIWAVHPLNLTSVLYVVQRMTSLSAMFVLTGVALYVWGRDGAPHGYPRRQSIALLGVLACSVLATLSKENGVLIMGFLFAIEITLFRFRGVGKTTDRTIAGFFIALLLLPVVVAVAFIVSNPAWLVSGYDNREFSLEQRLLTEPRVIWQYISFFFVPNINAMGLFHDDLAISTTLTQPQTTLWSLAGLMVSVGVAIGTLRRLPLLALGIFWFLVGHALESTVFPLELMHEHRNYLPAYGLLIMCLQLYLSYLQRVSDILKFAITGSLVASLSLATAVRASEYGNPITQAIYEVTHHPASARSNYEAGRVIAILVTNGQLPQSAIPKARTYLERAAELNPNAMEALFALLYLEQTAGEHKTEAILRQIETTLSVPPYVTNTTTLLATFLKQVLKGDVTVAPERVVAVLKAALGNPGLQGDARGIVSLMLSSLYARAGNEVGALQYAYNAVQAAPNQPIFRVAFAKVLLRSHNYAAVHEQLSIAKSIDRLGLVTHEVQQLEKNILDTNKP